MESREDILKELKEIAPQLATLEKVNVYQLPEGYFNNFTDMMLEQVKPIDAKQEIEALAPALARLSKPENAEVPASYFTKFSDKILNQVRADEVAKELATVAPLLSGLQKVNTLQAPVNYFSTFADRAMGNVAANIDAPVTGNSKWFEGLNVFLDGLVNSVFKPKYTLAFAGVTTTVILGVLMFIKVEQTDDLDNKLAQISTAEIDNYLENKTDGYSDEVFEMNLEGKGVNDSANINSLHPYKDALKNIDDADLNDAIAD